MYFLLILLLSPATSPAPTEPSPAIPPERVVRLCVEALGENDNPRANAGVELCWRFASPSNKKVTGPLDRFNAMIRGPLYAPLLEHTAIEWGPSRIDDEQGLFEQVFRVQRDDGTTASYVWRLERVEAGLLQDCWVTTGVTRLDPPPVEGELI